MSVHHVANRAGEHVAEPQRLAAAPAWDADATVALAELSEALISTVSLEEISILVLEHAKRLTASRFGYVGYIDPQTGYLVCPTMTRDVWDVCHVPGKNNVFQKFGGLWGWVLTQRRSLLTNAPAEEPRSTGTPAGHIPIRNFLSAPALIENHLVGQVALANARRDYTEEDLALVERLAALYALAIHRQWAAEALHQKTAELNERVKELNCLYSISKLTEQEGNSLAEILRGVVNLIPAAWQFPASTCARVVLDGQEFATVNYAHPEWKMSSPIVVYGQRRGAVEVCYLEEKPAADCEPFLRQERDLLDAIAERLSRVIERKRTEEALRASELQYRRIIAENIDGMLILDAAGCILFANRAAEQIFARELAELTGNLFGIPTMGGEPSRLEIIRPDHEIRVVEVRVAETVWEGRGGYLATLRDITEREQMELARLASEKKYHDLFENAPLGIFQSMPQGKFLIINPALARMFGYATPADFLNAVQDIGTDMYVAPERRHEVVDAVLQDELWHRFEQEYYHRNGDIITVNLFIRSVRDAEGEIAYLEGFAQDITARKRAEQELRRSNAELQQFANILSHDLQAPLRTVSSFAGLLARRYQGQLDQDAHDFIDYITNGAKQMSDLVSDLLRYARVDAKGKELIPTDSAAVLAKILTSMKTLIEDSAATVDYTALPLVMADAVQLGQLFQNLISNALKFRGAAAPHIQISAARRGEDWQFAVRDNGIGMAPRHLEEIFILFRRLHTSEEYPGTGLGLSLCRKIVERHGGRIWAESQPGAGATFYFTLPAVLSEELQDE